MQMRCLNALIESWNCSAVNEFMDHNQKLPVWLHELKMEEREKWMRGQKEENTRNVKNFWRSSVLKLVYDFSIILLYPDNISIGNII